MISRQLTLADKLEVLMEVREHLMLSPEEFRLLVANVLKGSSAQNEPRHDRETKVA